MPSAIQHHFRKVKNSFIPIALCFIFIFTGIVPANQKQIVMQSVHNAGEATSISVTFGTPNDSFIAGKPIFIRIRVTNTDGLLPGTWCFNAVYRDTYDSIRRGGYTSTISFSSQDTAPAPLGSVCSECLTNGIDTAKIILYSASISKHSSNIL